MSHCCWLDISQHIIQQEEDPSRKSQKKNNRREESDNEKRNSWYTWCLVQIIGNTIMTKCTPSPAPYILIDILTFTYIECLYVH